LKLKLRKKAKCQEGIPGGGGGRPERWELGAPTGRVLGGRKKTKHLTVKTPKERVYRRSKNSDFT